MQFPNFYHQILCKFLIFILNNYAIYRFQPSKNMQKGLIYGRKIGIF